MSDKRDKKRVKRLLQVLDDIEQGHKRTAGFMQIEQIKDIEAIARVRELCKRVRKQP